MTLVWVTGSPGAGKSAACALLRSLGGTAVDADWEGFSQWTDRVSGRVVTDPPYPVPPGWLGRFAWKINRSKVETLASRARNGTAFLFGSVENEVEVWDLFDLVICLVVDDETVRERLGATDVDPIKAFRVSAFAATRRTRGRCVFGGSYYWRPRSRLKLICAPSSW